MEEEAEVAAASPGKTIGGRAPSSLSLPKVSERSDGGGGGTGMIAKKEPPSVSIVELRSASVRLCCGFARWIEEEGRGGVSKHGEREASTSSSNNTSAGGKNCCFVCPTAEVDFPRFSTFCFSVIPIRRTDTCESLFCLVAGADLIRFSPLVVLSRLRHSLPPPSNGCILWWCGWRHYCTWDKKSRICSCFSSGAMATLRRSEKCI